MRRRDFLELSTAAAVFTLPAAGQQRKKIAALSTTYHVRSHTDNFVTRFLEGYWIDDRYYPPPCDIVSLYMDQVHPADIGYRLASAYDFPVVKSIEQALTLGTGKACGRWSAPWSPNMAITRSTTAAATLPAV